MSQCAVFYLFYFFALPILVSRHCNLANVTLFTSLCCSSPSSGFLPGSYFVYLGLVLSPVELALFVHMLHLPYASKQYPLGSVCLNLQVQHMRCYSSFVVCLGFMRFVSHSLQISCDLASSVAWRMHSLTINAQRWLVFSCCTIQCKVFAGALHAARLLLVVFLRVVKSMPPFTLRDEVFVLRSGSIFTCIFRLLLMLYIFSTLS